MINYKPHYCSLAKILYQGIAETRKERNDADPQGSVILNKSGGVSFLFIKTANQMNFYINQLFWGENVK